MYKQILAAALALAGLAPIMAQPVDDTPELLPSVAMWAWTDRYTYTPGQAINVRWTLKNGGDAGQYTIFVLRQNNQDGRRFYFPSAGDVGTDIFNRTATDGFQAISLPNVEKELLIGQGGRVVNIPYAAPDEPGMHTIIVQIRDRTGTRVMKAAYFKFGIVRGEELLPQNITENRTLTNDRVWRIRGIVSVRNGATLTVEPGTFIVGEAGSQPPSVLLVTTEGRLNAEGTRSRPIVMTSAQPFGQRQRGDWGGLVMLGRAIVNDPGGSLIIEGLPDLPETRYGGTNDDHNCGSLRYVRVEFAGALLRPNEETNSFTWGGCGKQTRSSFLQAHYGLDDSFEWFGGSNDAKYLVGTYGADDYLDVQIGYRGRVQYAVGVANSDLSNRGVEADNYERDFAARPLGIHNFQNLTFVGSNARGFDEADAPCLYYRRGAGGFTNNTICFNWTTRALGGANLDSIEPNIANGTFDIDGLVMWDNGTRAATSPATNTFNSQVLAGFQAFGSVARRKFQVVNPNLRRPLEYSDPDFRPRLGSPALRTGWTLPPDDGFFDQFADFAGAFGEINWTEEWTVFIQEQDIRVP